MEGKLGVIFAKSIGFRQLKFVFETDHPKGS